MKYLDEDPEPHEMQHMIALAHNCFHHMMADDARNARHCIDIAVTEHGPIWIWYALLHFADMLNKSIRQIGVVIDWENLTFIEGDDVKSLALCDPAELIGPEAADPAAVQAAEWISARATDDEDKARIMFRALLSSDLDTIDRFITRTFQICAANTRSLGGCPL